MTPERLAELERLAREDIHRDIIAHIRDLEAQVREAREQSLRYKSPLDDMLWQFAYQGVASDDKPILHTAGLSALERAFAAVGWSDPHVVDESNLCDVAECPAWVVSGLRWEGMYLLLCSGHAISCMSSDPRPELRAKAHERESRRDANGVLAIATPFDALRDSVTGKTIAEINAEIAHNAALTSTRVVLPPIMFENVSGSVSTTPPSPEVK